MDKRELIKLLKLAKVAALQAGDEIMQVYDSNDFGIESKADHSPITLADKAAHRVISEFLLQTAIPILSEEGQIHDFETRQSMEYLWIVDPLDGTKEFIKRNGEFTVNIALVRNNEPILGIVYAPVFDHLYYGAKDIGAWSLIKGQTLDLGNNEVRDIPQKGARVVTSRSHLNDRTVQYLEHFEETKLVKMGSSLKFMLIAEGKADVYPRFAPTMEWDTAAADAILRAQGGQVVDLEGNLLTYNKADLYNPFFIAT